MKDLKFIQACPSDNYYIWQVHTWIESLRELGLSDKAVNLIFTPKNKEFNKKWEKLASLYPEAEWFFQKDEDEIGVFIGLYPPIIRPYILSKYFRAFPDAEKFTYYYCDCDIIFTKVPDIEKYLDDDISYVSDTKHYIGASYFDSKIKDVLPGKIEEYKKRDILSECCHISGITRLIAEQNEGGSGGAQYLLKGLNAEFWEKVVKDCIVIRAFLQNVNRQFFENESKGFQSWTADMWAVLWNLWYFKKETKIVPEMDFAWSCDNISKLENVSILHNAGIIGDTQAERRGNSDVKIPVFYKGNYVQGINPIKDPKLQTILNSDLNKTLCNHVYLKKVIETINKYNLIF